MAEHGRTMHIAAWNLAMSVAIAWTVLELLPEGSAPASTPVVFVEKGGAPPPSPAVLPPVPAGGPQARLIFAGDIMQHASQTEAGSFDASYERIAPILRTGDVVVGNLEFPVLASRPPGPDGASVQFNGSPAHLDALKNAGFTVLSTSNNHAFDQGTEGMQSTISELERRGIGFVGSAATKDALDEAVVMRDVHGIRIAFFAYTGLLNTYLKDEFDFDDPPADLPLLFANFNEWTAEYREQGRRMFRRHAERARAAGAEFVVALVHWGEEWHFAPIADQRAAATDLVAAGFDLVVGGHGHVLNSPQILRGRVVVYSLGNFSCDFEQWQARTGALLDVTLRRDAAGVPRVASFGLRPLLVRREGHVVEPLDRSAASETGERRLAWDLAARLLGETILADPPAAESRP